MVMPTVEELNLAIKDIETIEEVNNFKFFSNESKLFLFLNVKKN